MLDNQVLDEGMEILEGRFKVIKRLGSGSFGEIYQGKSLIFMLIIFYNYSPESKRRRIFCCQNCKY